MFTVIGERVLNISRLLEEPAIAKYVAMLLLKAKVLKQFRTIDIDREEEGLEELKSADKAALNNKKSLRAAKLVVKKARLA